MGKLEKFGFLYINGLGNGHTTIREKAMKWWWSRAGLDIQHAHVDWYESGDLEQKLRLIEQKVTELLKTHQCVAIIGASAGGSLAVNAFYRLRDENVCAISAHGRLAAGDYDDRHRMSLYRRAKLDTDRPSQAFFDSVAMVEREVIPKMTDDEKKRILILTQLTDMVVPMDTMVIKGVKQHRSLALGHLGGFLAHLLADRDLVTNFAHQSLTRS